MRVGILALQGGIEEHERALATLHIETHRVRLPRDLLGLDGLVIPGGESTVIDKLARSFELAQPLQESITQGLPTFATCAGLIYCAKEITNPAPGQQTLGVLDVKVQRNAFGSQRYSFDTTVEIDGRSFPVSFIRAPEVVATGPGVEVLAKVDGRIVAVRQGHITAVSFHPEEHRDAQWYEQWVQTL